MMRVVHCPLQPSRQDIFSVSETVVLYLSIAALNGAMMWHQGCTFIELLRIYSRDAAK